MNAIKTLRKMINDFDEGRLRRDDVQQALESGDFVVLLELAEAAAAWRVAHEAMLAAYQYKERDTTSEAYEAVKRAQVALVEAVKVITS